MLVSGFGEAVREMIRQGTVDLPDTHAEIALIGTRVQLRIGRDRRSIEALLIGTLTAAEKVRGKTEYSDAAKVHFTAGLYSLVSDGLVTWHRGRMTSRALRRKVKEYLVAPRDALTGKPI